MSFAVFAQKILSLAPNAEVWHKDGKHFAKSIEGVLFTANEIAKSVSVRWGAHFAIIEL